MVPVLGKETGLTVGRWDRFCEWYLPIRAWEKSGAYKWLGVRIFKYLVPTGGDFVKNRWGFRGDFPPVYRGALGVCLDKTKQNELVHIKFFLVYLIFLLIMPTIWALLLNILVNVYPALLQRYNRVRIERILARHPAP